MTFKKKLIIFSIIAISIYLTACCNCGKGIATEKSVRGTITVIGNEPFTKLAIKTDDGKIFILQCSKELNDELWKKQGSYYYVQYGDMREESGTSAVIVEKVIPIVKETK